MLSLSGSTHPPYIHAQHTSTAAYARDSCWGEAQTSATLLSPTDKLQDLHAAKLLTGEHNPPAHANLQQLPLLLPKVFLLERDSHFQHGNTYRHRDALRRFMPTRGLAAGRVQSVSRCTGGPSATQPPS